MNASADPRRQLIERVLSSAAFAKSERLSSLLAYVCAMRLEGRAAEINEQRIGEAVFGRRPDYDSSIDGIVRTQASRLRHRLDLYFGEEGADEPLRIVIPRGGYVPFFEARAPRSTDPLAAAVIAPADQPLPEPEIPPGPELTPPRSLPPARSAMLAWSLVASLVVLVLALVAAHRSGLWKAEPPPAPHPLWSRLFAPDQTTLLVTADSGLVMWQGMMRRSMGLAEYLNGDYRSTVPESAGPLDKWAANLADRRYTSVVDLEIAQALLPIAQARRGGLATRFARDLRPNDFKQGDVILLGVAEADPWVELFERNMNFYFRNDRDKKIFSVVNRAPRPNEPPQWDSAAADAQHRVYAVVAFVPNLNGQGDVLILEGTSMAGTECAWDFVADDAQLLPFLAKIRRRDGVLPHFEVVLGANNLSGSAAKSRILAWRAAN